MAGLSAGIFPTSSDGTLDIGNVKVEEDVDVIQGSFMYVNKELEIGIKQEQIPEDMISPDIKSEPDEVSYVCVCLLLGRFYLIQKWQSFL
jgi:hypothetical protein